MNYSSWHLLVATPAKQGAWHSEGKAVRPSSGDLSEGQAPQVGQQLWIVHIVSDTAHTQLSVGVLSPREHITVCTQETAISAKENWHIV